MKTGTAVCVEQRWAGEPSNPNDSLRIDQQRFRPETGGYTFPSSSTFLGCLCYKLLLSQEVSAKMREMI